MTVETYGNRLATLLEQNNLGLSDLPKLKKELLTYAKLSLADKNHRHISLEKLKRDLEGLYVEIKNISSFISIHAGKPSFNQLNRPLLITLELLFCSLEHSKTRNRLRRSMSKVKTKAKNVISRINQQCGENYVTADNFNTGLFPWYTEIASSSGRKSKHKLRLYVL